MTSTPGGDVSVSRIIKASPQDIYGAFIDPAAISAWRRPEGMTARVHEFDAREGGGYRMSLDYVDTDHAMPGKTSEHSDGFRGRFVTLVPGQRIVEEVDFESDDPKFRGTMTIITTLEAVPGGTKVTFACENAPRGIKPEDHEMGMQSSLADLAAFTE